MIVEMMMMMMIVERRGIEYDWLTIAIATSTY